MWRPGGQPPSSISMSHCYMIFCCLASVLLPHSVTAVTAQGRTGSSAPSSTGLTWIDLALLTHCPKHCLFRQILIHCSEQSSAGSSTAPTWPDPVVLTHCLVIHCLVRQRLDHKSEQCSAGGSGQQPIPHWPCSRPESSLCALECVFPGCAQEESVDGNSEESSSRKH